MEKEIIRQQIAKDLRGVPSRNPDSLIPNIAKALNIREEDVADQVNRMTDMGYIVKTGLASIRLSESGDRSYFSTSAEKVSSFWKLNWPHLLSNAIAFLALIIALCAFLKK